MKNNGTASLRALTQFDNGSFLKYVYLFADGTCFTVIDDDERQITPGLVVIGIALTRTDEAPALHITEQVYVPV